MLEYYLALLGLNVTVAGIAFAAFIALREAAEAAAGDEGAALIGRTPTLRRATVWIAVNAVACLGLSSVLATSPELLPRWDPGLDFLVQLWPVSVAVGVSSALAAGFAAWGVLRAASVSNSLGAAKTLIAKWTRGDFDEPSASRALAGAREAAMRALHRARPRDSDAIMDASAVRVAELLPGLDPKASNRLIETYRDAFLIPVAEEAILVERPDQAARASRAATSLLHVADPTQQPGEPVLSVSERVLDLVLGAPRGLRATASVVDDIYASGSTAIERDQPGEYFRACWAWLPFARMDPGSLLSRNGVVETGGWMDADRPLELLIERLDNLRAASYRDGAAPALDPGALLEVCEVIASGIAGMPPFKRRPDQAFGFLVGVDYELHQVVRTVVSVALDFAKAGDADRCAATLPVLRRVAAQISAAAQFARVTEEVAKDVAHVGLVAEETQLVSGSSEIANDVAAIINAMGPGVVAQLKHEISSGGQFGYSPAADQAFLARLVT